MPENKKKKNAGTQLTEEIRVNLPPGPAKPLTAKKKFVHILLRIIGILRIVYRPQSNEIRTSKYTIVNFLFLALFEEFKKPSNIWFLIIAVITLTPASPVAANQFIVFFVFVLFVGLLKAGIEDIMRHKADNNINLRPVQVIRGGIEQQIKWKNILPGDIIQVKSGEEFPADMVLIATSVNNGICYVSTANLDGETTLKTKQAIKSLHHLNSKEQLTPLKLIISAEHPSPIVDRFNAYVNVINNNGDEENLEKNASVAVDHNNLLIRSTVLKNTDYIYGVVVYSGRRTKYALNTNDKARHRRSHLERKLDRYVIGIAIACLVITSMFTIASVMFDGHWYIPKEYSIGQLSALTFFTFLAVISGLIPLALYITLDLVRLIQMYTISHDPKLYDEEKQMRAASKSANLHEELGQIQYIFSDKTGTLTKNKMIFRTARIGQHVYGSPGVAEQSKKFREFIDQYNLPIMEHFHWEDDAHIEQLISLSKSGNCDELTQSDLFMFWLTVSLCHSVVPSPIDSDNPRDFAYQASSPDEKALVEAATQFGFFFKKREYEDLELEIFGILFKFQVLNVLEFSSDRKRMSVIVKTNLGENDRIFLFSKGADTVMVARAASQQPYIDSAAIEEQTRHFASDGLRTIVIAFKELQMNEYNEWFESSYKPSVENLADRQKLIDAAAEVIEKDITLLGITGIEDSLQTDVPETISLLLQAGIKFWVVTGDKKETAVNIAVSCQLVVEQNLLKFIATSETEVEHALEAFESDLKQLLMRLYGSDDSESDRQHRKNISNQKEIVRLNKDIRVGAVLDGHTLTWGLQHNFKRFMKLITRCDSVIICRATPLQKEQVVKAIKKYLPHSQTLAIGDGGNDVSMLRAADVGIGLPGEEGRQAAMAADFLISQFNRLSRLVLVRGRYFYTAMAFFLFYFFYRSFAFITPRLWANGFAAFSGNNFYQALFDGGFNLRKCYIYHNICLIVITIVFASLPILVVTAGERDLSPHMILRYPELYRDVANNRYFNRHKFVYWLLEGIYHGTLVWAIPVLVFSTHPTSHGSEGGEWTVSAVSMLFLVVLVNLQLAHRIFFWTTVHHGVIWGSIALCLALTVVYALPSLNTEYTGVAWFFLSTPEFYLSLLLLIVVAFLPSLTFMYIKRTYYPSMLDIVQEQEQIERIRKKKSSKEPSSIELELKTSYNNVNYNNEGYKEQA